MVNKQIKFPIPNLLRLFRGIWQVHSAELLRLFSRVGFNHSEGSGNDLIPSALLFILLCHSLYVSLWEREREIERERERERERESVCVWVGGLLFYFALLQMLFKSNKSAYKSAPTSPRIAWANGKIYLAQVARVSLNYSAGFERYSNKFTISHVVASIKSCRNLGGLLLQVDFKSA